MPEWFKATNGGSTFGSARFKERVVKAVNGCVEPKTRGLAGEKRRDKRQLMLLLPRFRPRFRGSGSRVAG
jgi:hypothetical protein